jgi:hypothetical protein
MENTGKTIQYLRMSRACRACHLLANDVRRYYGDGGHIRWGGWKILSIKSAGTDTFEVRVDSAPTSYQKSASGTELHLAGGLATHQLTLDRVDGTWRVVAKAQLAS